jgi:transketolase
MKLNIPSDNIVANPKALWHDSLAKMGESNQNIIALTADLSRSICTETFRKKFPDRYFNVGIAEQNMFGMAAGLALCGKIPYCVTFAPFASMRASEQFRTDVCYMNLNVRVITAYGGVAMAGSTHSGLEDAGIMRGFANNTVVVSSEVNMVPKIFEASVEHKGPLYIRLGVGANEPNIYGEDYVFEIGKAILAKEGKDATIISTGVVLRYAVEAANELSREGIDIEIIDIHTLKPIDKDAILKTAHKTGIVITMEDHSIYNGLGSAVAETILEGGISCKFRRLGIPDIFPVMGYPEKLHIKYGYGKDAAVQAIKAML